MVVLLLHVMIDEQNNGSCLQDVCWVSYCTTLCPPDAPSRPRSLHLQGTMLEKNRHGRLGGATDSGQHVPYDLYRHSELGRRHDNPPPLLGRRSSLSIWGSTETTTENDIQTNLPCGGGGRLRWGLLPVERWTTTCPTTICRVGALVLLCADLDHSHQAIFFRWDSFKRFHLRRRNAVVVSGQAVDVVETTIVSSVWWYAHYRKG
jgi:hypothetical protein